jgi:hypothetical protein
MLLGSFSGETVKCGGLQLSPNHLAGSIFVKFPAARSRLLAGG